MLVTLPIPNLVGGVSQQPSTLKLSTSSEEDINIWPSVVTGLNKRPPSEWIKNLGITATNGAKLWLIDRESSYQYAAVFNGTTVAVYDFQGNAQTVTTPDGTSYITTTTPIASIKCVTIADTTFVLNTEKVTAESSVSDSAPRLNPSGRWTVFVAQSVANAYYAVYVDGVKKAEYLTPKGVDAASSVPGTDQIAESLRALLVTAGYTVTRYGSTLAMSSMGSSVVSVWTTNGDKVLRCYSDTIDSFANLPPNEVEGRIVKVQGDVKVNGDDYYVIYDNKGLWSETWGYGSGKVPDATTMPFTLVRNTDGTWTFKKTVWDARVAGDANSNGAPSFIGFTISDMFLYNARLGFLSNENFILSQTDNLENFYRTTLTTLVDNDVIDYGVYTTTGDELRHAVPFDKSLLLLSDKSQYRVDYNNFLGPKNVQVSFTTTFDVSPNVSPVNMGNSIYFVDDVPDRYDYAKVFEYFTRDNRTGDDADEATQPIPQYIPKGVQFMSASPRIQAVVVNSSNSPNTLYLHKFFWTANQKIQTAWFKWTFLDCTKVLDAKFSRNYMYVLLQRGDSVTFERIKCDEQVYIYDANNVVRLLVDRLTTKAKFTSITYDSVNDRTVIVLPWSSAVLPEIISSYDTTGTDDDVYDQRHTVTASTTLPTNTFYVPGNIVAHQSVTAGIPYNMLHRFSKVYVRQAKGNSEIVNLDTQRIQMRYLKLEYHDTAYFTVVAKYPGRADYTTTFESKAIDNISSLIGRSNMLNGVFSVALVGTNQDLTLEVQNDSPYPCAFGSAEFSGILSNKISLKARI